MIPPRTTPKSATKTTPEYARDINWARQSNFALGHAKTISAFKTPEWDQDQIALTLDQLTSEIVRRFGHDAVAEALLDRVHLGLLQGRDQYRALRRLLGSSDYTDVACRFLVTPTMTVADAEERAAVNQLARETARLVDDLDRKRSPHAVLAPAELAQKLKSLSSTLADVKRAARRTEPKFPPLKQRTSSGRERQLVS